MTPGVVLSSKKLLYGAQTARTVFTAELDGSSAQERGGNKKRAGDARSQAPFSPPRYLFLYPDLPGTPKEGDVILRRYTC